MRHKAPRSQNVADVGEPRLCAGPTCRPWQSLREKTVPRTSDVLIPRPRRPTSRYPLERSEVFLQTFSICVFENRRICTRIPAYPARPMVSAAFPALGKSGAAAKAAFHRPPAHFCCSAARGAGPESVMSIEAASAVRAAAADYREAARHFAHMRATERADVRRDQRIEEARASAAARSRPSDRAAELPEPRPRSSPKALLLDVLA